MDLAVVCHACGRNHAFADIVPFRADCEACSADMHVCLNCRFYDRYADNECREDIADPVSGKDRRNLCEYFKPKAAGSTDVDAAAAAKAKLAALFGGSSSSSASSSSGSSSTAAEPVSAADEAK
ncbi:MAG TPA: hypothetical protein VGF99_15290, partial [Myxococcota bacterium]